MTNIETYYFQYFLTDIAKFSVGFATTIGTVLRHYRPPPSPGSTVSFLIRSSP